MPLFSTDEFDAVFDVLTNCAAYFIGLFNDLIVFVRTYAILYIPILLFLGMFSVFVVGFIILSVSDKAYGIKFTNLKFQNPNNYYMTSFPAINQNFKLGRKIIRTHINEQNKIKELNRKMAIKNATDEESLKYANRFFENNPWAYRITLNGRTYFRPGWSEVNWRKGKAEYKNRDVSFDVNKAMQKSKLNRSDFGDPKYKRKH